MDSVNVEREGRCHVAAMPYPGRGHINPMMNFCELLATRSPDILVSLVVTEEWVGCLAGPESEIPPPNMRFCSIPNVVPSELDRGADIASFLDAVMTKMEAPFERLLDGLEPPATVIVADLFLHWALEVGNRRNIPMVLLCTLSASVFWIMYHFNRVVENKHFPVNLAEKGNECVDYIPGLSTLRIRDLPTKLHGLTETQISQHVLRVFLWEFKPQFIMFTSIYELEAIKDANFPIPFYTIGPTAIPYFKLKNTLPLPTTNNDADHYLQWLHTQPPNSVVYISFGSIHSIPNLQMEELNVGLCIAGVRFLWAICAETNSQIKEQCSELGLVVPWCDQLKVLCHPSVGGFWTHCGWNSVLEGIFAGVPMLAFPLTVDQITNSKIVVEDLKIGWRVRETSVVEVETLVNRDDIAWLVQRFMDLENAEIKDMRKRVRELQDMCLGTIAK
ncbi:UDP-glycosyltransferase 87A2-like [Malania oleifera]|uniref:UDP-glycosyltransferase 87A2-like n=1 Tax=Malania oleifera TaxID=397392 RepID=UPI0025AE0080|nr:UDP-glycosyltransferase 87A2-like [Malania oleifera]